MVCSSDGCSFHNRRTKFDKNHGQTICNGSAIVNRLAALFNEKEFCDVRLEVGDKIFYAHKLILSASSPVLKIMLTNSVWTESTSDRILLKEDKTCWGYFERFLRYMYCGTIHLDNDSVLAVLMLADKYQVNDLSEICIEYMTEHISSHKTLLWYQYALTSIHSGLLSVCENYVVGNFDKIISSEYFVGIDLEVLADLLQRSDIVVSDEFAIFQAVKRWVIRNQERLTLHTGCFNVIVQHLTSLIRFPMIAARQLATLESDSLVSLTKPFIFEKLELTRRFHSCPRGQRSELSSIYTPRTYTDELWCATLMLEKFSELPPYTVRGFMFSTPISGSEADEMESWEWNVNVFPKGICFPSCMMIGATRNYEIVETVYDTVRISVIANGDEPRSVNLVILIYGSDDGVEFVRSVVERRFEFDSHASMCVINDLVPYADLNGEISKYMCDPYNDTFKISIIVKPV